MSSSPPNKQSSGGFTGFLEKIGNTLSSFSPFAAKPLASCPPSQPVVEEVTAPEPATAKPERKPERKAAVAPKANHWELTVFVRCVVREREPDLEHSPDSTVLVQLKPTDGPDGTVLIEPADFAGGIGQSKQSRQLGYDVQDKGKRSYEITVTADKWEMVSSKAVALNDGDDVNVVIEIRRLKWIAFQVVSDRIVDDGGKQTKKELPVEDVTLDLTLPGGKKSEVTTQDKAVRVENLQDGTCKIDGMSHEELWEVENISSQ